MPHHELLLIKLGCIGITRDLWSLDKKLQCVSLGNNRPNLLQVVSGVPQEIILRPLIFLVHVNYLHDAAASSQYADDTKCTRHIEDVTDYNLQRYLHSLCEWSGVWKLIFKLEKCAHLRFTKSESTQQSTYHIYNKQITRKTPSGPYSYLHQSILWESLCSISLICLYIPVVHLSNIQSSGYN